MLRDLSNDYSTLHCLQLLVWVRILWESVSSWTKCEWMCVREVPNLVTEGIFALINIGRVLEVFIPHSQLYALLKPLYLKFIKCNWDWRLTSSIFWRCRRMESFNMMWFGILPQQHVSLLAWPALPRMQEAFFLLWKKNPILVIFQTPPPPPSQPTPPPSVCCGRIDLCRWDCFGFKHCVNTRAILKFLFRLFDDQQMISDGRT